MTQQVLTRKTFVSFVKTPRKYELNKFSSTINLLNIREFGDMEKICSSFYIYIDFL